MLNRPSFMIVIALSFLEVGCIRSFSPAPFQSRFLYPIGSYGMVDSNNALSNALLSNPGVEGILLAATWKEIEGNEGQFDFSGLDNRIGEAQKNGLKVALKIVDSPTQAPDWIINNPQVQTISLVNTNRYSNSYCSSQSAPVFWDPVFRSKRLELIRAVGTQYGSNPTVVAVMASFANFYTDDWEIPQKKGAITNCSSTTVDQVSQWQKAGYTPDLMLEIGKEIISTTAAAFPFQAIKLPIGPGISALDGNASFLAEQILNYAYGSQAGNRFYSQWNRLSTQTPAANTTSVVNATADDAAYFMKLLKAHSPQIGFQMLAGASNGATDNCRENGQNSPCDPPTVLQNAIDIALTYSPHFLEYWQADAESPTLYSDIKSATASMSH